MNTLPIVLGPTASGKSEKRKLAGACARRKLRTMKKVINRLEKLEKVFARVAERATVWGSMVEVRDRLLRLAKQSDAPSIPALREQLERLGPAGLWRETARGYLCDHGFVQSGNESLAQTMARALGISTHELRICIADGRIGSALLERFSERRIAADNTN